MEELPPNGRFQLPFQNHYGPPFPLFQEEKEVDLRDYWKIVQKRRWTIIACFFIVVITTALMTFTMRPIYRATATIQIDK